MALATLTFEIDADLAGFDKNTASVEDRLDSIDEKLGSMADSAKKSEDAAESLGKKMDTAFAIGAVKLAAKAIKELGGFILDSAKAAADAGSGPMKRFVNDVDLLKQSFVKVGAQAASQLLPMLDSLTKQFTQSKDAAQALKDAGNFIANVFRVLATVGAVVVATFDAVGKSIGAVASAIVDVLAGNFAAAGDTMAETGKDMEKILDRLGKQIETIWKPGGDFKGSVDVKGAQRGQAKDTATAQYQYSVKAIQEEVAVRKQLYGAIGDEQKQFQILTAGTSSFDDAMHKYEAAATESALLTKKAANDQADGLTYLASLTKMEADAWKASADKYSAAAEQWHKKQEDDVNTLSGAMNAFGGAVLKAIPRLNDLVQAAMQGAQVGGAWGALIAVIVQLMSQTTAFQRILDVVNGDLDQFIQVLDPIVSGLASLMEAFDGISNSMTANFGQIFKPIGDIIQAIAPLFKMLSDLIAPLMDPIGNLGDLLKPLVGILSLISSLLQLFAEPLKIVMMIFKVLGVILKIFQIPLQLIGALFQGLSDALKPVFDEIDKAFSWLSNRLDEFGDYVSTLPERIENAIKGKGFKSNFELTEEKAQQTAEGRAVTGTNEGLDSGLTDEQVTAIRKSTDAQEGFTKATLAATAALTNVPAGYKVAIQRFTQSAAAVIAGAGMATLARDQGDMAYARASDIPHLAAGGIVDRPTMALIGEAGPEAVVPLSSAGGLGGFTNYGTITVVSNDPDDFLRKLRRKAFTRKGAAFG
jgi:hypothetical protein